MASSDESWKGPAYRAAEEAWNQTLSRVESVFGRMVLLSSLRNGNTGRYEHHGMAMRYGADDSDAVLRESHEQAFREWLAYPLPEQKADLDLYLNTLDVPKRETVQAWLGLKPFRHFLPARVRQADLQLYLADLTALLEVLKAESGAASPDPDA